MGVNRLERWVPLVYLVAAFVLAVALFPTVLRPPNQQPPGSPELSPDAPPDDDSQSIAASLNRASSATAGSSDAAGPGSAGPPAVAPPAVRPRACPRGFGEPMRQVESLYAAPCAAPFSGDNGGETWRGVTGTEIRVAVVYRGGATGLTEGPVSDEPQPGETAANRTLRAYQRYFNELFQFHGRQLRLFALTIGTSAEDQTAGANRVADEFKAFASVQLGGASVPYNNEANRRQLLTFNSIEFDDEFYRQRQPLAYNWRFSSTTALRLSAEYICKKLVGKPASFGGDDVKAQPRRFGILYYSEEGGFERNGDNMDRALQEQCGERLAVKVGYDLRDTGNVAQQMATALTRMRQENVTTIIYVGASIQIPQFAAQADQLNYQPEWFLPGINESDKAEYARPASQTQWNHAFGLSLNELPRRVDETDAWRAYREVDPSGTPDAATAAGFPGLMQLANGIQTAGPRLTPTSFAAGLHSIGKRTPVPVWSVGGGYAPNDGTYAEYASEMWWDFNATDPVSGQPGAYRYVAGGRRFTFGEVTTDPPLLFSDGAATGW